jgi:hypothetical protein
VPVAEVMIGVLVDFRIRSLKWWAAPLTATYLTPLVIWVSRADRASSLSKDMDPVFYVLIAVVSALFLVKIYTRRRR